MLGGGSELAPGNAQLRLRILLLRILLLRILLLLGILLVAIAVRAGNPVAVLIV